MLYVPTGWWKMLDVLESYIVYNLKSRIGCTVCGTIDIMDILVQYLKMLDQFR